MPNFHAYLDRYFIITLLSGQLGGDSLCLLLHGDTSGWWILAIAVLLVIAAALIRVNLERKLEKALNEESTQ